MKHRARYWLVVENKPGVPYARHGCNDKNLVERLLQFESKERNPRVVRASSALEAVKIYERITA